MNAHEAVREAIAAYALDSLSSVEREALEPILLEHVVGCVECAGMLREFREVTGDLALVPPAHPVAATSESRLMQTIRERDSAGERPRRRMLMRGTAAVGVLALAASGAWNVTLAHRVDRSDSRATRLAQAISVMKDPEAVRVELRGLRATMVLAFGQSGAALVGTGVPDPPGRRVLELWLLRDGKAVPVSAFRPDGGVVAVRLSIDPSGFAGAAITVEDGFVSAPTTDPVYAGTIGS